MMATTALPASVTGDMMEYLFEVSVRFAVQHVTEELTKHVTATQLVVSKEMQKMNG